jgi:ParB-like chromosome segregation protein Spo0J
MAGIVERIPQELQAIFGSVSDELGRTSGFIKRARAFSGAEFVRALVFGWLGRARSSIESLADRLGITGSALQQRLTKEASEFLRLVFAAALSRLLSSRNARIPLLSKFNGVYVEDCSTVSLPAEMADEFRGCGGSDEESGKAALRLFTSYELKTGTLKQVATAEARGPDSTVAHEHAPKLPRGALRVRDLGFFDRQLFEKDTKAGVYWISRVPANVTVRASDGSSVQISEFLANQPSTTNSIDCWMYVGQADHGTKPLHCRLIAVRCPPEVVARRRQKVLEAARRKGRTASQRQLLMCDWTVLITNVPEDMLPIAEAWELYCARWQIELLFKRWKGLGGIQVSTKMKRDRVLCELYAKLLGMLVAHWFALIRGGPLEGFSLTKAIKKIQAVADRLADSLRWPERLAEVVAEIAASIDRIPKQQRRTKQPSTRQRLFHSRLKV